LQRKYFANCLSIHVLSTVYTVHMYLTIIVYVSNAHRFEDLRTNYNKNSVTTSQRIQSVLIIMTSLLMFKGTVI